jgi:RNA polymerase sigma factor (sigma-70 family)
MATSQVSNVIQQLHKAMLVQEAPDGQLLESFVSRREAAALEALVRRHGPMVWNVCRRVLRNQQDAEDAFQATFLVFVRKAAFIVPREMVGNWLYGVAHQTALKANTTTAKRRTREKQVTVMPEPAMTEQEHWSDLQPILDQEIGRLPDHYRVVIVLCDLEGKTRSQAAQQLGWPEGTVAGRLARARTTLAKRLVQRGIVLSGGSLAAVLAQQAASAGVPGAVMTTTIHTATLVAAGKAAATAAVPAKVAALTEGVVKAMLLSKLKNMAVIVALLCLAAFGGGLLTQHIAAGPQGKIDPETPGNRQADDPPKSVAEEKPKNKKEPKFVPIASYASGDRPTEKRIRELLDAAKITFVSVGSRGQTVNVLDDKAKQARAILEKAVVDGTLSVTVLDQLPVPKNLRAVRTDDKLRIEEDTPSNEEVIVSVAAGLIRSTDCWLSVYRGNERVSHTGGTYTPVFDFNRNNSKIPQPGESYEVELVVKWFETDAPIRPNWAPQSGGKYKVLVTRTLKLSVGPENTQPAPSPDKNGEAKQDPPKNFTNSIGMKFVWIPPGNFMMGSPNGEEGERKDETQHKVTLTKGFYMGVYSVTQEEWQQVMGKNPSRFKGEKNLPVEMVDWEDCQKFIKKLREKDKKAYRLPTEAEWEYSCRAGTTTPFHFGNTISTDQANYNGIYVYGNGKKGVSRNKTTPVGNFPANAWGLHDMHGNVYQWCQDWYGDYPNKDVVDPQGPEKGELRVFRGSCWADDPYYCRSAFRGWIEGGGSGGSRYWGLRVCFSLE